METVETTEVARRLRRALRAYGWGPKEVSVRTSQFSLGSAIDVIIKSPTVSLPIVARLALAYRQLRQANGANFYVTITDESGIVC